MQIPFTKPYFNQHSRKRIIADIDKILQGGRLMMGPFQKKFEERFNKELGMPYSVSVNSCTTALTICLKYFNVANKEVLVPSGSFITSISSIVFAGGKPVLVDMNEKTLSFDLEDLQRKITKKTKGIIWVHLTGVISPEYKKIISIAKKRKLFLIEDAAHALGATIDGNHAGTLGDAGCFSFYPTKIVTTGTGGMITSRNLELKNYAEKMRLFGKEPKSDQVLEWGNDWFLDEIRCCLGYHQLNEIKSLINKRRKIAHHYREALQDIKEIFMLRLAKENKSSYYQFPIFVDSSAKRDQLVKELKQKYGISTKTIYKPCHEEKIFLRYDDHTLYKTADTLNRSLCLPIYPQMTNKEMHYVTESIKGELKENK